MAEPWAGITTLPARARTAAPMKSHPPIPRSAHTVPHPQECSPNRQASEACTARLPPSPDQSGEERLRVSNSPWIQTPAQFLALMLIEQPRNLTAGLNREVLQHFQPT